MPGTGKTATVKEVLHTLMQEAENGELPPFKHIEINAMKLQRPHETYSLLWRAVSGQHASDHISALKLERHFSTPNSKRLVHVVLVDELDHMVTRKQRVLYNLFNWPTYQHSRLVVVGIANTMDLPERLLPRISSRMGLERVKFKGYTVAQIETIMKARLTDLEAFHDDAVEMCAKKVAQYWGDMRRALQIARRAAEICDREGRLHQKELRARIKAQTLRNKKSSQKKKMRGRKKKKQKTNGRKGAAATAAAESGDSDFESDPEEEEGNDDGMGRPAAVGDKSYVSISHIMKAAKELDSTPSILAIKHTADYERLFLAAVVKKLRSTGVESVPYQDVVQRFNGLLRSELGVTEMSGDRPSRSEVRDLCRRLGRARLIVLEDATALGEYEPSVRLQVAIGDVARAIRDSGGVASTLFD